MNKGEIVKLDKLISDVKDKCMSLFNNYNVDDYSDINTWRVPITDGTIENGCTAWASSQNSVSDKLDIIGQSFRDKNAKQIITAENLSNFIVECFWESDRLDCLTYTYYQSVDSTSLTTVRGYGVNNRHSSLLSAYSTLVQSHFSKIKVNELISAEDLTNLLNNLYNFNVSRINTTPHDQRNKQITLNIPQWVPDDPRSPSVPVYDVDNDTGRSCRNNYLTAGYIPRYSFSRSGKYTLGVRGSLEWLAGLDNETFKNKSYENKKYMAEYKPGEEDDSDGNSILVTIETNYKVLVRY